MGQGAVVKISSGKDHNCLIVELPAKFLETTNINCGKKDKKRIKSSQQIMKLLTQDEILPPGPVLCSAFYVYTLYIYVQYRHKAACSAGAKDLEAGS